jgi:p-methyltransferase
LKSFLAARGLNAEIVNFFNYDCARLIELLAKSPRTVAITTTVYTMPRPVRQIVEIIREHNPDTGAEPQAVLFQKMDADIYVFDSQGENALAQLLLELRRPDGDFARVPNLSGLRTASDSLSASAGRRATISTPTSLIGTSSVTTTSRHSFGCTAQLHLRLRLLPLSCSGTKSYTQRYRGPTAAIPPAQSRGVKFIYFIDDTFNVPLPRFKKLCKMMIEENFGFQRASYFRCANADEEAFDLIKEAGCVAVSPVSIAVIRDSQ